MAKVTLTIKNGNVKESQQFEIDKITTFQALKLKNEIHAILKDLKNNGELKEVLEGLFSGDFNVGDLDVKNITAEQLEQMKDEKFITGLAGAFDRLLETVPERAMNLLSIMSGIDREVLEKAYLEELFDVYDAVMEENDIIKLIDRMKRSFFTTKGQWSQALRAFLANK